MLEKLFPYCGESLASVLKEPVGSELKTFPHPGGTVCSGQKSWMIKAMIQVQRKIENFTFFYII